MRSLLFLSFQYLARCMILQAHAASLAALAAGSHHGAFRKPELQQSTYKTYELSRIKQVKSWPGTLYLSLTLMVSVAKEAATNVVTFMNFSILMQWKGASGENRAYWCNNSNVYIIHLRKGSACTSLISAVAWHFALDIVRGWPPSCAHISLFHSLPHMIYHSHLICQPSRS